MIPPLTANDLSVLHAVAQDGERRDAWMKAFNATLQAKGNPAGLESRISEMQDYLMLFVHDDARLEAIAKDGWQHRRIESLFAWSLILPDLPTEVSDRISFMWDVSQAIQLEDDEILIVASKVPGDTQAMMEVFSRLLQRKNISAQFRDRISHLRDTLAELSAANQPIATASTVWGEGERP